MQGHSRGFRRIVGRFLQLLGGFLLGSTFAVYLFLGFISVSLVDFNDLGAFGQRLGLEPGYDLLVILFGSIAASALVGGIIGGAAIFRMRRSPLVAWSVAGLGYAASCAFVALVVWVVRQVLPVQL